ncbi:inorganic phosphate transporter [Halococcus saccharolyticus]|uniref:Phosphate transporter n=1 Tax=Halococcus saccharolyticus DSM 5350 TaxID=1227455 RepID=M0MGX6_9EURY|nr:inorganic phosphate transporter [Halococcus saccharolyticus]EMA44966.1 putative phosphate permease [Halococcus saccharolyticus DSM 5350]
MVEALLVVGGLVAVFVGYNIGGSSTGVAFGPAVGSRITGKTLAAVLFTAFALLGGWTVGQNVITTMGSEIVAEEFTLAASVVLLFFTGISLLISNLFGVPASTSMTAVGAIAGLGVANGTLNEDVMFGIVSAWIVAPLVAFWIGVLLGRYIYPHLDARVSFGRIEDGLFDIDRSGTLPRPRLREGATARDIVGAAIVLVVACYNAFSAGASNTANAVAPLVGSGAVGVEAGTLLAVGAMGIGAFTIARRTLDTVGDGITDLPILAAILVSLIGASIITVLSNLGIPASLAVSMTSCIIGLGWGRASRTVTLVDAAGTAIEGEGRPDVSVGALVPARVSEARAEPGAIDATKGPAQGPTIGEVADAQTPPDARQSGTPVDDAPAEPVPKIGEEDPEALAAGDLFDRAATGRIVSMWLLTPTISAIGSYLVFAFVL